MNLALDFRQGPLTDALERTVARINVLWKKEHDPDTGAHTNITAKSLVVTGGITADSITAAGITADHLNLKGERPYLQFTETDQIADNQAWQITTNFGQLRVQTSSVDGVTRSDALNFFRIGLTPTAMATAVPLGVLATPMLDTTAVVQANGDVSTTRSTAGFSINVYGSAGGPRYFTTGYAWTWGIDGTGRLKFQAAASGTGGSVATLVPSIGLTLQGGLEVPAGLTVSGPSTFISDAGAITVRLVGRASDNFSQMFFLNNAQTQTFAMFRTNVANYLEVGNSDFTKQLAFNFSAGYFYPVPDTGMHCGHPTFRWHTVYALTGAINTSDVREKDLHGETPLGLDFIRRLQPVQYRFKRESDSAMRHGLVAQDVKLALQGQSFAGLDEHPDRWGLNYGEFIAPIIKAIQELDQRVTHAEDQIEWGPANSV